MIKSIIISSGSSPTAYVLSLYKTSIYCNGNQVFAFDPLTFTSNAVWAKKTSDNNCFSHSGITFGREETIIYAYSRYFDALIVSRIDNA
jgi:hypothetical protein